MNEFKVLLIMVSVVLASSAVAHHSVYGEYSKTKPLAFSGTLEKVEWVNPHVLIHIKDAATGTVYQLEVQGPSALGLKGWHGNELAPGSRVEVVDAYLNVRADSTLACCAHIYDGQGYEYFTGYAEASDRENGIVRKGRKTDTGQDAN